MSDIRDQLELIKTRQDLAGFIVNLQNDFKENADDWENVTIPHFLDALAAIVEHGLDGLYFNAKEPVPGLPTWKMIGELLMVAARYE